MMKRSQGVIVSFILLVASTVAFGLAALVGQYVLAAETEHEPGPGRHDAFRCEKTRAR